MMDQFSREFEKEYLTTLKQRHTTKRVNANSVYQEVIQEKQHIHMNATKWATLTDFVKYLGKTGKCVVDETERGWYVQFIENDASILARKEAQERRAEAEKAAEIAQAEQMERQRIEAAKALDRAGGTVHSEATSLERSEEDPAIKVALNTGVVSKKRKKPTGVAKAGFFDEEDDDDEKEDEEPKAAQPNLPQPKVPALFEKKVEKRPVEVDEKQSASSKRSKHEDYKDNSSNDRKGNDRSDGSKDDDKQEEPWLKRDIIVRIISKKLADGKYFKRKAVVDHVVKDNKYVAEVEVLDSDPHARDGGDILRLDQKDLETVIPKEGKKARILKGKYRGRKVKVLSLDKKKYRATVKVLDGDDEGKVLDKIDYDAFSKLA